MPVSIQDGKREALDYIASNFSKRTKVIDIGAGAGYWGKELRRMGFRNVDAPEVYEPYIRQFGLSDIYDNVINKDCREFDFSGYDFAIMGDVLEHLTAEDARTVLDNARLAGCRVLASVPWMCRQGASGGVEYERHLQADLTRENATRRFGNIRFIYCGKKIGVFVA